MNILEKENLLIRELEEEDVENKVKEFKAFADELVEEEDLKTSLNDKKSLEEQKDWLQNQMKEIKRKKRVRLLIEDEEGRIVGSGSIKLKFGKEEIVGFMGASIRKGYRNKGIGTIFTKRLMKLAEEKLKPPLRVIKVSIYETNKRSIYLCKKLGFEEVARVPMQFKHNGNILDEIIMLYYV